MTRRWNAWRVASGVLLAGWASVFWFLLVSGRTDLFLSSRTSWVVPLGAVVLTGAALGRLATARSVDPRPLTRREGGRLALIALPVVAILTLPPVALGSFAADRRSQAAAGFRSGPVDLSSGEITMEDVVWATWSPKAMAQLATRAGSEVDFTGIVTRRDDTPADEFFLTRFIISCCVADALALQVRIVGAPPGKFQEDEWVSVEGTIFPLGREVVVQASSVERVPQPENPYLTP